MCGSCSRFNASFLGALYPSKSGLMNKHIVKHTVKHTEKHKHTVKHIVKHKCLNVYTVEHCVEVKVGRRDDL